MGKNESASEKWQKGRNKISPFIMKGKVIAFF